MIAPGLPLSAASLAARATRSSRKALMRVRRSAAAALKRGVAFAFSCVEHLFEDAARVALHAQIARERPHRRAGLERIDVDMRPERFFTGLHVARKPRHVDVDQDTDVGVRHCLVGGKADEAWAVVGDVVGHVGFVDGNAGELRQRVDRLGGMIVAPGIAGDQDRIFRRHELVGERGNELRIGAAAARRGKLILGIAVDLVGRPALGQRLALHHQIDRAAGLALHDRMGAPQRFLDDNARGQGPFPFQIGPHQARLVERLLDEMHVGVARADQLVVDRIGRLAGHQQHRQAAAIEVMHGVGGVGGADIDMDQHALAAAGDQGIARGHVSGGVLVRTAHYARHRFAALFAMRHLVDDRGVIGAEIAEQIIDADFREALEEIIGRGVIGNVGAARGGR